DNHHVETIAAELGAESRDRNDGMACVGTAVHPHLRFLLHHADDGVWRVVEEKRFSNGRLVAEDVFSHFVADKNYASALDFIFDTEKAATGNGIVMAALPVIVIDSD